MLHQATVLKNIHAHVLYNQQALQVSADNLARHAMPGAQAVALAPYSFKNHINADQGVTHARHIGLRSSSLHSGANRQKNTSEISANGNSISPEQELQNANTATLKITNDIAIYKTLTEIYSPFASLGAR